MIAFRGYTFRRTTLICAFCISVLGGIGFAHTGKILMLGWFWSVALLLIVNFKKRSALTLFLTILFGFCIGCWRGSVYMQKLSLYEPYYFQKITMRVRAAEDATYGKTKQMSFSANNVMLENGQRLAGKIQMGGFGINAIYQGDEIVATGKLYPGFGAYQGRISFAALKLVAHHPSIVAEIRRKFAAGMQTALPEPLAPFAMGLLIGQRATLPAEIKQDLLMVGLTHIIAVSGYNLTIILNASKKLLAKRSKRLSTLLSVTLIALFLLLAGASASIVRAAIVSLLSIGANYYGRNFRPVNLIVLAAVITAWANPFYIWSDLSWYLSFLAFYGVMVLAPLIQSRWPGRWHNSLIAGVALESICAEIMSLPFVLHIFGQMSLIGLPANVLVVTMVPLAMLLGTIAGLGGMLAVNVVGWFAWPATVILSYMLDIAHVMAHIPHIFVENRGLSIAGMLGFYILIIALTTSLWHKTKHLKPDTITDMDKPKTRGLLA